MCTNGCLYICVYGYLFMCLSIYVCSLLSILICTSVCLDICLCLCMDLCVPLLIAFHMLPSIAILMYSIVYIGELLYLCMKVFSICLYVGM